MSKITVLVVEDHIIVRQGIVSLINREDDIVVVEAADDGRQAIKLCKEKRPDIVVMDLSMPHLNGIEATRIIKNECPESRIVTLSMYSEEEYILKALDAGISGYLIKKNAAEDLIKAIRAVHAGRTFFSVEVAETIENYNHFKAEKSGTFDEAPKKKKLTSRELEVLQLIAEGYTSKKISEELYISINTVQRHREKIMQKTGIHDVAGLTRYALKKGIIQANQPGFN
ncbi:MAG: response regulator [Fidelibacterota bacterium]